MLRRLDDDLVRADAVEQVEHAEASPVQLPLDLQHRELVGDHAHLPARRVRPAGLRSKRPDLGRGLVLVPLAQRARTVVVGGGGLFEVRRPAPAFGGDDDPAVQYGVLAEF